MISGKHLGRVSRERSDVLECGTYSLARAHNKLKLIPTLGREIINYKYAEHTSVPTDGATGCVLHCF